MRLQTKMESPPQSPFMPGIRGRLAAARVALSIAEKGSALHTASSSAQAASLRDYLRRAMPTLSCDDKAALVPAVAEVCFLEIDMAFILNDLVLPGQSTTGRARRPQQDYLAFVNYLTEQQWSKVLDPERNASSKQEVVFALVSSLGLRFPSQPTKKRFCSFNLLLTNAWDQSMGMPMQTKKLSASTIGDAFTVFARAAGPPVSFIEKLPADPSEMRQRYPSIFAAVYPPGHEPVLPKIDTLRLQMLDDSFRCRGTQASLAALAPTVPTINTNPINPGMEQFATMMATCMHTLGEQQTRMMEMMLGSRGVGMQPGSASGSQPSIALGMQPGSASGSQPSITPPRGLQRLLEGSSPLAPQGRRANLTLSGSRSLSHSSGSEYELASLMDKYDCADTKAEKAAPPAAPPAAPLAAPPVEEAIPAGLGGDDATKVALGGDDATKVASERAAKMLDLLGDRDEERKKKRQAMIADARAAKKTKAGAVAAVALADAAAPMRKRMRIVGKTSVGVAVEAAKRGIGRPRKT
jgi:hypothetical protein